LYLDWKQNASTNKNIFILTGSSTEKGIASILKRHYNSRAVKNSSRFPKRKRTFKNCFRICCRNGNCEQRCLTAKPIDCGGITMNYFGLFFSFLIPGMIIGALIAVGVCTDKFKKSETTSNFRTHNVCVPDDAKRGELLPAPTYTLRERAAQRNQTVNRNGEVVDEPSRKSSAA
jgi:hypothetical protein